MPPRRKLPNCVTDVHDGIDGQAERAGVGPSARVASMFGGSYELHRQDVPSRIHVAGEAVLGLCAGVGPARRDPHRLAALSGIHFLFVA